MLLFCSLFSLVGNSIYFLGNSQDDVMLLLIGRGLAGIGAGVVRIISNSPQIMIKPWFYNN